MAADAVCGALAVSAAVSDKSGVCEAPDVSDEDAVVVPAADAQLEREGADDTLELPLALTRALGVALAEKLAPDVLLGLSVALPRLLKLELVLPVGDALGRLDLLGDRVTTLLADRLGLGDVPPETDGEWLELAHAVCVTDVLALREGDADTVGVGELPRDVDPVIESVDDEVTLLLRVAALLTDGLGVTDTVAQPVWDTDGVALEHALRRADADALGEREPLRVALDEPDVHGEPDELRDEAALREDNAERDVVTVVLPEEDDTGEAVGRELTLGECDPDLDALGLDDTEGDRVPLAVGKGDRELHALADGAVLSVVDTVCVSVPELERLEVELPLTALEADEQALDDAPELADGDEEMERKVDTDDEDERDDHRDGELESLSVRAAEVDALAQGLEDDAVEGVAPVLRERTGLAELLPQCDGVSVAQGVDEPHDVALELGAPLDDGRGEELVVKDDAPVREGEGEGDTLRDDARDMVGEMLALGLRLPLGVAHDEGERDANSDAEGDADEDLLELTDGVMVPVRVMTLLALGDREFRPEPLTLVDAVLTGEGENGALGLASDEEDLRFVTVTLGDADGDRDAAPVRDTHDVKDVVRDADEQPLEDGQWLAERDGSGDRLGECDPLEVTEAVVDKLRPPLMDPHREPLLVTVPLDDRHEEADAERLTALLPLPLAQLEGLGLATPDGLLRALPLVPGESVPLVEGVTDSVGLSDALPLLLSAGDSDGTVLPDTDVHVETLADGEGTKLAVEAPLPEPEAQTLGAGDSDDVIDPSAEDDADAHVESVREGEELPLVDNDASADRLSCELPVAQKLTLGERLAVNELEDDAVTQGDGETEGLCAGVRDASALREELRLRPEDDDTHREDDTVVEAHTEKVPREVVLSLADELVVKSGERLAKVDTLGVTVIELETVPDSDPETDREPDAERDADGEPLVRGLRDAHPDVLKDSTSEMDARGESVGEPVAHVLIDALAHPLKDGERLSRELTEEDEDTRGVNDVDKVADVLEVAQGVTPEDGVTFGLTDVLTVTDPEKQLDEVREGVALALGLGDKEPPCVGLALADGQRDALVVLDPDGVAGAERDPVPHSEGESDEDALVVKNKDAVAHALGDAVASALADWNVEKDEHGDGDSDGGGDLDGVPETVGHTLPEGVCEVVPLVEDDTHSEGAPEPDTVALAQRLPLSLPLTDADDDNDRPSDGETVPEWLGDAVAQPLDETEPNGADGDGDKDDNALADPVRLTLVLPEGHDDRDEEGDALVTPEELGVPQGDALAVSDTDTVTDAVDIPELLSNGEELMTGELLQRTEALAGAVGDKTPLALSAPLSDDDRLGVEQELTEDDALVAGDREGVALE